MYESCGICALSEGQQKKMMKGLGVRVKTGDMSVMLSAQQAKKLKSATKKGAGMVLQLDPYQVDMLKGGSFFDKISRPFRQVVEKVETRGKQLADKLKRQAEMAHMKADELTRMAIVEAEKGGREVEKVAKSDAVKRVGKKVAGVALRKGLPALGALAGVSASGSPIGGVVGAELGSIAGNELAEMAGVGLKKTLRKVKKGGALRVAGGALRVAGRR
tara:strand:- start:2155 stop:2805 length:651 start_codon:yes stop_codon:yes gene_type:complete